MKVLRALGVLLLVSALVAVALVARDGFQVAMGYSAKQVCSGVFVAGLPAEFVLEKDVRPAMAMLGPIRAQLQVDVLPEQGVTEAHLLGASVRAVHRRGVGCVLHGQGPGTEPLAPPQIAGDPVPPPEGLVSLVDAAFAEPEGAGRNTLALLLWQDGELLAERYAPPVTAATRLQGWSMNKSLMATWIGLQARRGALDPTQSVASLLGDSPYADALNPQLTLLHLTQMESGLDFVEIYGPGSDATRMLFRSRAAWQVPASRGEAHAPGSHFSYSSGDTVLASYLWQRSLEEPYARWIDANFANPLGIRSLVAEPDASGVQMGSSFAYMTARDWLRAGRLWLDAWHGRSTLLDTKWLRDSVTARPSDDRGRYGRGFWLNTAGAAFDGLPESLFHAGGYAGQYVVVVPEWELVVARLGLTEGGVDDGMGDFLRGVAALRGDTP